MMNGKAKNGKREHDKTHGEESPEVRLAMSSCSGRRNIKMSRII